ncbi:MAG: class I SAM-dependent methyltransferase [Actinobacteria bacterium]|nr:class I SAM-dependent methyltransferase [Actinomycetota bacterium]
MELGEYRLMADVEHSHWWYDSTRKLLQQILGNDARRGGRFLDVGAGTGATGAWLAEHGDLVASDFLPLALELNRERHPALGFVVADATKLPFATASFDVVLCVTVLCHQSISDPQVAVAELARVLRPGGVLCLWEPGVRRLRRAHDRVTHSTRRFSRGDLSALLGSAGLAVERSSGAYSFLVPPAAAKAIFERGSSASDLDRNQTGLAGTLGVAARCERALLRKLDLPAGLSVFATARRALPHVASRN